MLDGLYSQKNTYKPKKSNHPWGPLPAPGFNNTLDKSKVSNKYNNNPKIRTWEDRNRSNNGTKLNAWNTNWSR